MSGKPDYPPLQSMLFEGVENEKKNTDGAIIIVLNFLLFMALDRGRVV